MPISKDTLDRLPERARNDVIAIDAVLSTNHGVGSARDLLERLADAFADMARDHRTAEQHRRDLYIVHALSGFCRSPHDGEFKDIAADAIRAADETMYSVDAPDLLAELRSANALLKAEVERLTRTNAAMLDLITSEGLT